MTTRQALRQILERMREEELHQILDFARFVSARAERGAWTGLALAQLDRAYGPGEPEYTEEDLRTEEPE